MSQATVKKAIESAANDTEKDNIICCLDFLSKEATNAELKDVADIIRKAVKEVARTSPEVQEKEIHKNFLDLVIAFKLFIKFYLIGDKATREALLKQIDAIDKEALRDYVY